MKLGFVISGAISPVRILKSVDFPWPLSPRTPILSPSLIVRLALEKICLYPSLRERLAILANIVIDVSFASRAEVHNFCQV